jgi:uncharacterized iron-regulated membrane protein
VVIATGLVLSFEPVAQQTPPSQPITASDLEAYLTRFDPDGRARSLAIRTYDNTLTIGGTTIDLATGGEARPAEANRFNVSWWDVFLVSRRMHEALLLDLSGLVIASTIAMLAIMALGTLMGWPRLRQSLRGWHQCAAWFTLPLLVISPLTALAMAYGVTFTSPPGGSPGGRVTMRDAVKLIAAEHEITSLTSIRPRGGRLMARIYVDGELRGFAVTPNNLQPLQRNWPRVIHEGNWGGVIGPALNVLTSAVLLFLLGTGVTMWIRGARRRWARSASRTALSSARSKPA